MNQAVNYAYWRKFSALAVWKLACLMHGVDPRAYMAGDIVVNDEGDGLDLAEEVLMLTTAILTGDIAACPPNPPSPDGNTLISRSSAIPWLRLHGFGKVADGWAVSSVGQPASSAASGQSPPLRSPVAAARTAVGEQGIDRGSVKRSVLIKTNIHDWPTIERDIQDASANGLSVAARAGARGWNEVAARNWASAHGRIESPKAPDALSVAMNSTFSTRVHKIEP